MDTHSIIDTYEDFARKTKRKLYYSLTPHKGTPLYHVTSIIKSLYISNDSLGNTFLFAYQIPFSLMDELFFSVLFFPLP